MKQISVTENEVLEILIYDAKTGDFKKVKRIKVK